MIEVFVPRENVNDETVVLLKVYVKSGDVVRGGDTIVDIETSKTNLSVCAPESGVVRHELKEGQEVGVGTLLFKIVQSAAEAGAQAVAVEVNQSFSNAKRLLSNAAQAKAEKLGIKLKTLNEGWITSNDLDPSGEPIVKNNHFGNGDALQRESNANVNLNASHHVAKITKRKRAEIESLYSGSHQSTMSTIGISIRIEGGRLVEPHPLFQDSISDLVAYESARLLKKYESLNATYLNESAYAVYDEINFGWSFDSGKNLKVITIKGADKTSLAELQGEVMRLLELYESNATIPIDLLTSSTVTFTDLSRTEASFVLPLINGKQSLILAIAKSESNLYQIYASFDHRLSEGSEVAQFLAELRTRVVSYYMHSSGVTAAKCSVCEKTMREEAELGNRGFIRMLMKDGTDGLLCRNCFDGW